MHIERRVIGDYRILAAATPSSLGGFTAAVSVKALASLADDDLYANFMLADGFRFTEPAAALRYAFDVGYRCLRGQAPGAVDPAGRSRADEAR